MYYFGTKFPYVILVLKYTSIYYRNIKTTLRPREYNSLQLIVVFLDIFAYPFAVVI